MDANGVDVARKAYAEIPFYRLGVQDDPAEMLAHERPFGVVVSTEVIEHLFSLHIQPQSAVKVLKEDGYLIVSIPCHGFVKNLALSVLNAWDRHHTALWHGDHINFWSRNTLSRLLRENGFEVVHFEGVGRLPFLWKSVILVARRA